MKKKKRTNWEGVFLVTISIITLIVYYQITGEHLFALPQQKPIAKEVMQGVTLQKSKRELVEERKLWLAEMERFEQERIEAERIEQERLEAERIAAEIESAVWTTIGNYTEDATTQGYIYYAWQQFGWYGWSTYDLECLVTLWHRESRWNPLAHNSSSGAHGIPQSLPAEKMASHGDDYWSNGYTQILWGLDYISNRYGNPTNALSHSYAHNWY